MDYFVFVGFFAINTQNMYYVRGKMRALMRTFPRAGARLEVTLTLPSPHPCSYRTPSSLPRKTPKFSIPATSSGRNNNQTWACQQNSLNCVGFLFQITPSPVLPLPVLWEESQFLLWNRKRLKTDLQIHKRQLDKIYPPNPSEMW